MNTLFNYQPAKDHGFEGFAPESGLERLRISNPGLTHSITKTQLASYIAKSSQFNKLEKLQRKELAATSEEEVDGPSTFGSHANTFELEKEEEVKELKRPDEERKGEESDPASPRSTAVVFPDS